MFIYIFLSVVFYLLYRVFNVNYDKKSNEPPLYQSWSILGPIRLFQNPLKFAEETRRQLGSDIFSCWMLGRKMTFVFNKNNVIQLTDAKNNDLNFESAYATFIRMAFGEGILTRHTAPIQVDVLKKYLNDHYVTEYLKPTQKLATQLICEKLGKSGQIDLQRVLLDVSFTVGARNFLGDDFLVTLTDYDFQSIFNGFEMSMQFIAQYLPFMGSLISWYENKKPKTSFANAVLRLLKEQKYQEFYHHRNVSPPNNMFEEIIYRHSDIHGPSLSQEKILINLMKILVFAGGFNGYNMMTYILRSVLKNRELWLKLRDEQITLNDKFGPDISNEKRSAMKLLYRVSMIEMYRNTFPFLLRFTDNSYQINDYIIPQGHYVAYSPQLEHNGSDYIDDTKFNLIFGKGTHACPAKKYAINSMMIILSVLIQHYDFELLYSEPTVNNRLITFPSQPSIIVKYQRVA